METKRYRAKVANFGFRGQRWEADDIVEVSAQEAEYIPHHFEPLGKAQDGSDSPEMKAKLAEQAKLDHLKDQQIRKTYDTVRPTPPGGMPVVVEKTGEQKLQEAKDRKAEEKANDARRGKKAPVVNQPLPRSATPLVGQPARLGQPLTTPSGRPVPPAPARK